MNGISIKLLYVLVTFLFILIAFIFIVLWVPDSDNTGSLMSTEYMIDNLYYEDDEMSMYKIDKIKIYTDLEPNFNINIINECTRDKIYVHYLNVFKRKRKYTTININDTCNMSTVGQYILKHLRKHFYLHAIKLYSGSNTVLIKLL